MRTLRHTLLTTALALGVAPAAASGETITSTNWSGYAAHRSGVHFRQITASWTQPKATCSGQPTYSAFWVGLGGFDSGSDALEQIGTELDCSASGRGTSSAWYELVPAPGRNVRMTIRSGDRTRASVSVSGHRVTLRLANLTRRKTFVKRATVASIDTASAEWITEAPSACTSAGFCRMLPLTNFGTASFAGANAWTSAGRRGAIASDAWNTTRIVLADDGPVFAATGTAGRSTPTALGNGGTSFAARYSGTSGAPGALPFTTTAASARGAAVQPGGPIR